MKPNKPRKKLGFVAQPNPRKLMFLAAIALSGVKVSASVFNNSDRI
ncbi:hypothetical protein [Nostoc sp. C117]